MDQNFPMGECWSVSIDWVTARNRMPAVRVCDIIHELLKRSPNRSSFQTSTTVRFDSRLS